MEWNGINILSVENSWAAFAQQNQKIMFFKKKKVREFILLSKCRDSRQRFYQYTYFLNDYYTREFQMNFTKP